MEHAYFMYYNNWVWHFKLFIIVLMDKFTIAASAATSTNILDPEPANKTGEILNADEPMPPTSIEDEDPNEEIINDLDVVAEVTLPSTVHE